MATTEKKGNTTTTTGTNSGSVTTGGVRADTGIKVTPEETSLVPDATSTAETDNSDNAKMALETKYRLVVSFISIGGGIDLKTHEAFEKMIKEYAPKITAFEKTHWGREGEIDYCLTLSELSTVQQEEFVKKVKSITSKSDRVILSENEECVHKR